MRVRAFGRGQHARRTIALFALAAAAGGFLLSGRAPSTTAQSSSVAQRNLASGTTMSRDLVDRFPGATVLGEPEFAQAVVSGAFRYREVGSELVIVRPKEIFVEGGQYRIHWSRTISYGTWAIARGIVSIDCTDCQYAFIG